MSKDKNSRPSAAKYFTKTPKGASLKAVPTSELNYKNPSNFASATSANGRILPARILGAGAKTQRLVAKSIKILRILALHK